MRDVSGIALDLGGTKVAAARVLDGVVTERVIRPTDGGGTPEQHVAQMYQMACDLGLKADERVGMAVAGRVDAAGFWHAVNRGTLSAVQNANLAALVRQAFGQPVPIVNDALAATIAEYELGAGVGSNTMAYITISTGVGGGFVIDGHPLESTSGLAGHIGFTTSRLSARGCGCGRVGTVESVAGGRAMAAIAAEGGHPASSAKQVFSQWYAGADWAAGIIDPSAAAIAELIANLTTTIGLDRVVLGGSIGLAEGYADRVRYFSRQEPALFCPRIVSAGLGQDSVLLGALIKAM